MNSAGPFIFKIIRLAYQQQSWYSDADVFPSAFSEYQDAAYRQYDF
jgi:hypothetical protein